MTALARLRSTAESLPLGTSLHVPPLHIVEAVRDAMCEAMSWPRWAVNQSDIDQFIAEKEKSWGITLRENLDPSYYVMRKPFPEEVRNPEN